MNKAEFKEHNEETLSPVTYVGADEYTNAAGQVVSSGGHLFKGYVNIKNNVNILKKTLNNSIENRGAEKYRKMMPKYEKKGRKWNPKFPKSHTIDKIGIPERGSKMLQ